jgi:hypothetical protein
MQFSLVIQCQWIVLYMKLGIVFYVIFHFTNCNLTVLY